MFMHKPEIITSFPVCKFEAS